MVCKDNARDLGSGCSVKGRSTAVAGHAHGRAGGDVQILPGEYFLCEIPSSCRDSLCISRSISTRIKHGRNKLAAVVDECLASRDSEGTCTGGLRRPIAVRVDVVANLDSE